MTPKQREFLRTVLVEYDGTADNGNLMWELGWERPAVAAVGRGVVRRGWATYVSVPVVGFEGGIYSITPAGEKALKGAEATAKDRNEKRNDDY